MDEVLLNSEHVHDDDVEEFEINGDCEMTEFVDRSGVIEGENPPPPAVGMEFETYDDVYYFYSCYAKERGFGVRVSNTWYRKSRERYRGKLSCSSAGFKKKTEANKPRPETRTGCPAMIKFRLMENRRWKVIEVELEHNHLIHPRSGKFYKSHKNIALGCKRPLHGDDAERQKNRLFRTVIVDTDDYGTLAVDEPEFRYTNDRLNLKPGDARAMHDLFAQLQLTDPNFFYVMDLNEKGCLKNVFWADSRSKAAYRYFGDAVSIDSSSLSAKYEVPLVVFSGVNHHEQLVPLGCGLVAGETVESFVWLLRTWLTYMVGRPPQTVVISHSKAMQSAVLDVFPRAAYCFPLSDELGGIFEGKLSEVASPFERYLSKHTPLKEFFDNYVQALEEIHQRESLADIESKGPNCTLKSRFLFEDQLSKSYTSTAFKTFQREIEGMFSFSSTRQEGNEGAVVTHLVKEQVGVDDDIRETRDYEVVLNMSDAEVVCSCGLFNSKGLLCRHALSVLSQNGIVEIPPRYILSRWRKDIHRSYVLDNGCDGIDVNNPVHRYDSLYKCVVKVMEEGKKSLYHYNLTMEALGETMNKLRVEEDLSG